MTDLIRYPDYKVSGVEWLGDIPSTWDTAPIKFVASYNDEVLSESTPQDTEITYVEISDVSEYGGVRLNEAILYGEAPSRARRIVRRGDVLVSTVRTYLRAIAAVEEQPANLIASTGFAVLRATKVEPEFLRFAMLTEYVIDKIISRSVGVSYPAINASDLVRVKIPVPSRHEQRAIAAYLDHETTEIDAFIADQKELTELLRERRAAVRTSILHDAAIAAQIKPLKRSASVTVGIVVSPSAWYADDGVPALRGTNVKEDCITLDDIVYLTEEGHQFHSKSALRHNDVVVVRTGQAGAAARIPLEMDGYNAIDLLVIKPSTEITGEFLTFVLNSTEVQEQVRAGSVGAIQGHFNVETLRNLNVPVPALEVQVEAVNRWEVERGEIDAAISDAKEAIELSKERRAALISAAVTGKIDVRNHITAELGAA